MAGDGFLTNERGFITVEVPPEYHGRTIAEALRLMGLEIDLPCGGNGRCGKCEAAVAFSDGSEKPLRLCRERTPQEKILVKIPHGMISGSSGNNSLPEAAEIYGSSGKSKAFLAVDLGTTTIEALLMSGETPLCRFLVLNPQKKYGADVISRIAFSQETGGLERLSGDVRKCVNGMLEKSRRLFPETDICDVFVAGNTTMQHLFLGVSPAGIGRYPFKPEFTETKRVKGTEVGLETENLTLLPSADAFIGADVVAGVAEKLKNESEPALLIDLGTNGEMVLKSEGVYYSTSSAAGPCFEGANISCGTGGVSGAISGFVRTPSGVRINTVGGRAPAGLCGSGLISLISMLLEDNIIDETGLMEDDYEIKGLINSDDPSSFADTGLTLTRKDVREFQLAKAAIRTGIDILLEKAGITPSQLARVYTAGGLGKYLEPVEAVKTGIFPEEFEKKVVKAGNTSLTGAVRAGSDPSFIGEAENIASVTRGFSLNEDKDFNARFVDNMYFE